jgi:hypothetical protein
MSSIEIGKLMQQPGGVKAFIPSPFPPKDGFHFVPLILKKNDQATRLLGKLDGITKLLPDVDFFTLMYMFLLPYSRLKPLTWPIAANLLCAKSASTAAWVP